MAFIYQRITIMNLRKPGHENLNDKLQWIGNSLGLFSVRDKDKSCYRIFIELLKSAKKKAPLTSDEVASRLQLSRGTVIHHLTKLIEAGIVVHEGNHYLLRVDNLNDLIGEMEKDIKRITEDVKEIATEVDRLLGL